MGRAPVEKAALLLGAGFLAALMFTVNLSLYSFWEGMRLALLGAWRRVEAAWNDRVRLREVHREIPRADIDDRDGHFHRARFGDPDRDQKQKECESERSGHRVSSRAVGKNALFWKSRPFAGAILSPLR